MAGAVNIPAYSDALVVLGTAGIVVPLLHRLGVSPVLGYLAGGALLGPLGLGSFIAHAPVLYWVTVVDAKSVSAIADLGVVFLLFIIGLELSYERLMAMRRLVFGLGALQVVVTAALLAALLAVGRQTPPVAVLLGAFLALSPTAIVLEEFSRQGRLLSSAGRASFSVLLAQDLAVIPMLMVVPLLGADQNSSVAASICMALLRAAAAIGLIVLVGRTLLRPLFRQVAKAQSNELFIAAILFVILGTGVVAAAAGLSMALGAFVAGLLLAETEFSKAVEATIEPFKGLLLGVFFFTVGMGIDARELLREPLWLLGCVAGLIALKAIVVAGLARWFRLSRSASIETGLMLGPGGEFTFVGIGAAAAIGALTQQTASFTLAVTSLSMALTPLLGMLARQISTRLERPRRADTMLLIAPEPHVRHAIVVGHGRVGKVVGALLKRHGIDYIAVDNDAAAVSQNRASGENVYYGDATNPAFLKICGVMEASGVVVTIHTSSKIEEIVTAVRTLRPDIMIVSRARDAGHAQRLYAIGVTDAVPETIEASLQLSEAALLGLGIQAGPVIASIHDERDTYRRALRMAATEAAAAARSNYGL